MASTELLNFTKTTSIMPDTADSPKRYWLIVAARDHVQRGVEGGFCQANHGKPTNLKRMRQGDGVVFYSGKESLGGKTPLQAFTAIGHVTDDAPYQAQMTPDFAPFRRNVTFAKSHEVPIAPLLNELSFIANKTHWGAAFRFGFLEIPEVDFNRIDSQMTGSESV